MDGLAGFIFGDRKAGGEEKGERGAKDIGGESGPLESGNDIRRLGGEGLVEAYPGEKEPDDEDAERDFELIDEGDGGGDESLTAFSMSDFVEVANIGDYGIAENNADGNEGSGDGGGHQLEVRVGRCVEQRHQQGLK